MIPIVDGEIHHFSARGLYDGLFLMADRETNSYWDHITGECVHGPLIGAQLEVRQLHMMNASQAQAAYPNAEYAVSDLSWLRRLVGIIQSTLAGRARGFIPPIFWRTMGIADDRRKRLDMGLGLWSDSYSKYYPLENIQKQDNIIFDQINDRRFVLYIDPETHTPTAIFTEASKASWDNGILRFNNGEWLKGRSIFSTSNSSGRVPERPQQLFTRWYGFSYTFPNCEIFDGS